MQKMKFKVIDLLDILGKNKESHRSQFEEAIDGYKEAVEKWLCERLEIIKSGRQVTDLYFTGPLPEDHTKDYDRVIRMLNMTTEDQIELTETDFSQYVMDEWGWKQKFLETTANYSKKF
jgi:hypothetical protein